MFMLSRIVGDASAGRVTFFRIPLSFLFLFFFLVPACAEPLVPLHVERGTSLIRIARKFCKHQSDWKTIARVNHLRSPYVIYADATLRVPLSLLRIQEITARVAALHGTPLRVQGNEKRLLKKHDLIHPGETIITGPNDYVHLIFPDNKHSRIGPQSEMTLVYLLRLADGNLQAEFFLKKGKVVHKTIHPLKKNEHFETGTPMAITGIRGTEFRIKLPDPETSIVETLKGRVAVSAAGKDVILPKGKGSRIRKGKPPQKPRRLPSSPGAPELKDIYRLLPFTIAAPAHKTARELKLRITRDEEGQETVCELTARPGKPFLVRSIEDGHYFLFMTALDDQDFESPPSGPFPLAVRTTPAAPVISSPKNGLVTFAPSVSVQWLRSDLADHYTTQLAKDSAFEHILAERQTAKPEITFRNLVPGTYYFRVRLVAPDGFFTLYSETVCWTVVKQPEMGKLPPGPSEDGTIELRWPALPMAAAYRLQVARNKSFTDLVIDEHKLLEASYTIKKPLEAGTYFIRLSALLDDGQASPWTEARTMTIEPGPIGLGALLPVIGFVLLLL